MAVISRHISSRLQFRNVIDEVFQTMQRVRPNLDATSVASLRDSINSISTHSARSAVMTVSEELTEV